MTKRKFESCRSEDQGGWDPSSSQGFSPKVFCSKSAPQSLSLDVHEDLVIFLVSENPEVFVQVPAVISYTSLVEKPKELTSKNVVRFAEQNCLKIFGHCGFISDCRPNKRQQNHSTWNSAGLLTLSPRVT